MRDGQSGTAIPGIVVPLHRVKNSTGIWENPSGVLGKSQWSIARPCAQPHHTPFVSHQTTFMVRYILHQIKIKSSHSFGKWFAKNVVEETIDLDALAEHMSSHNCPYSKGAIKGVLTDMITCIKELLLEGKNVKIDHLAIFSLGIKNKATSDVESDFSISKNIEGVKLKARATGELMSKSLNLEATLKKAAYVNGKITTSEEPTTPSDSGNSGPVNP